MTSIRQIQASSQSDEELLQSFQESSSQDVLAILYLRYSDLVYGVCLKYLSDAEAAKDAVMNIYGELLQKLPHQQVNNFKSWLYVVAKNHCLMQLRSENKVKIVEFQPSGMQSEDSLHLDAVLEKEAEFKRLEECMKTLGDEQHRAIDLFYLQNKCYNEISDEMNWDWNKVRSLIQNGRRNLKTCMDHHGA